MQGETQMKINVKNEKQINEALNTVNKQVRNAYHYNVKNMISRIEFDLEHKHFLKKHWVGLKFTCNPNAQVFPNAYKGIPEATYFQIERFASGWFIVGVARKECRADYVTMMCTLTDEQKQAVMDAFYKF
jgi:hypothetical protein